MGFTVKQGSEKGSQKGFREGGFQKVPGTPLCRVRPLGMRPRTVGAKIFGFLQKSPVFFALQTLEFNAHGSTLTRCF